MYELQNEYGNTWSPVRTKRYREYLKKVIREGEGYKHDMALRQNIAYNLQYLEFIERLLNEVKLTDVLKAQNIKNFVIVGCSIIESLLTYLLIKTNNYKTTKWEKVKKLPGQQKKIGDRFHKIDSILFKKIDKPERREMDFDAMLKKAESKKILGDDNKLYSKLNYLRQLRNKVHLQAIDDPQDTDWNTFVDRNLRDMCLILFEVFTSNIFNPTEREKEDFSFLKKHIQ